MPYKTNAPQILEAIKAADHILLVSHEKPDGDTLGSSLALSHYLNKQNKKHKHFCIDTPAEYFTYLPRIEKMVHDYDQVELGEHDLIIALDCGDIKRTRIADDLIKNKDQVTIINIDHHNSNELFGHHNLVVRDASSTSEIMYKFFQFHNIDIDKYMATNLLTGILTDTMNFSNAATTNDSLIIASDLVQKGARIQQIINKVSQNKDLASLKLWGKILTRLEYEQEYNMAYTIITQQDLEDANINSELARDGLANFLTTINDVDIVLVLTQGNNNKIKGSLRTTKPDVDVARLAANLGGGGHAKAAGFMIDGNLVEKGNAWHIQ